MNSPHGSTETTEPPGGNRRSARAAPPFSTRGPVSFYLSLMRRHWKRLVLLLVLMSLFSGLHAVRLLSVGVLVDGLQARGAQQLGVRMSPEGPPGGRILGKIEEVWREWVPPEYPPITRDLGSEEGFLRFLVVLAVSLLVVGCLAALTYFFKEMLAQRLVIRQIVEVRKALFNHLTGQSVAFFNEQRTGDLISRVTNDAHVLHGALRYLYETVLQRPLFILVSLGVASWANWRLFVVSVPLYVILMLPVLRSGRKVLKHGRGRLEKLSIITEALEQLFSGIRIVKAFGMEGREREAFARKNQSFERSYMKMHRAKIGGRTVQEVLYNAGLAGLFAFGGWLAADDTEFLGSLVTFILAMINIYSPLKTLSKAWNQIQEARPAVARVLEIFHEEPRVQDLPGARDFPGVRERITFENVHFSYREDERRRAGSRQPLPALKGIDLEVRAGELVALVGPSGAGKSTLADLLARFYDPQRGRIAVDGVDIREYRHASYMGAIAVVTQDPFLFNTSILENIRYGRDGASDTDVVQAARVANADGFIREQPEGYDTVIGDRGVKLSGGERQRVTIARAVLKDAPILILDEATSALDSASEKEVQKALENLMRGRTTFVIAHRLSTVARADRIVVLEAGRIVESGRHGELLARRGRYHELYTMQRLDGAAPRGERRRRRRRRRRTASRSAERPGSGGA